MINQLYDHPEVNVNGNDISLPENFIFQRKKITKELADRSCINNNNH